jgi:hypothetical protein
VIGLVIGGVNEQLHVAVNALPGGALTVVGLFEDLLYEGFDFVSTSSTRSSRVLK